MSEPGTKTEEVKRPLCPDCKAELETLGTFSWTIQPNWLILGVHCTTCRVLLRLEIVPLLAPEAGSDPKRPPLVKPS